MTKWFVPPVAMDNPASYPPGTERRQPVPVDRGTNRWASYFHGRARGRTVLKIDGTYATYDIPTVGQIASATEVYLGGHQYEISDAVASALTAAGYTVYDTPADAGTVHGQRLIV